MNIASWLAATATVSPGAPALCTGLHLEVAYAEFARRASAIGENLATRHGIRPGDRVAVFMTNRTVYLEVLYGIWWAGAVAVPINAKLHPKEAVWILENSRTSLLFYSPDVGDALSAETSGLPDLKASISVESPDFIQLREGEGQAEPVQRHDNDTCWLFYTSGTTGRPKGVMITHGNIVATSLCYFPDVDSVGPRDVALYAAPISHGAGLYNFIHVRMGAMHLVPESGGFNGQEIIALARALHAEHGRDCISMFAAPTMVHRLIADARFENFDGTGIKTITYGGGPMYQADILEGLQQLGNRFVQIYGQGESPMCITSLPRHYHMDTEHPRYLQRLSSVGIAQSALDVRITGQDGKPLPTGEIGEVEARGTPVMAGYWENPTATAETLVDGWLRTGDVGALDADGFLILSDRSKDVIITGGTNVYPREVEETLLTHPDVLEASVVGREHPDWGEEIVACVVLRAGAETGEQDLDHLCLTNIARFKRPKSYLFLDALPKNNYGKVLKTDLRKLVKQNERA